MADKGRLSTNTRTSSMPQSTPTPLMSAQLWYGVPIQERAAAIAAARCAA